MLSKEGARWHRGRRREEQITFCLQGLSCFPPTWWWHHFPSPFSHRQSILWFAGRSWRLKEKTKQRRGAGMSIQEMSSAYCENECVCDKKKIRKEGRKEGNLKLYDVVWYWSIGMIGLWKCKKKYVIGLQYEINKTAVGTFNRYLFLSI